MGIIKLTQYLVPNQIYHGDSRIMLRRIEPESVSLSIWSPPYFVGKNYEKYLTYENWRSLLREIINLHYGLLKPGAFLAVNIADILCFKDVSMPKIMAENVSGKKISLTKQEIMEAKARHPDWNRYDLARYFGCSEQTVDRRLNGNNIRGGKSQSQTRVLIVGGMIEEMALNAGLFTYDRRIWVKDAAWENSRWHTISYRAVDEFEYLYIFWKPGVTKIDRARLSREEWIQWGSRGVWEIPSVRSNADHDSKFPLELPRRAIRLFTDSNDIVMDCFIGSGTTALAAIQEGRRYIGIDKELESVNISRKTVEKYSNASGQMELLMQEAGDGYERKKA